MRNSRYAIFILDSRSDGDRSGTFADVDFLKATILAKSCRYIRCDGMLY